MLNNYKTLRAFKYGWPDKIHWHLKEADDAEISALAQRFEYEMQSANEYELEDLLMALAKTWNRRLISRLSDKIREIAETNPRLFRRAVQVSLNGRDEANIDLILKFANDIHNFAYPIYNFDQLYDLLRKNRDPRFIPALIKHLFTYCKWCQENSECGLDTYEGGIFDTLAHPDKYYIIKSLLLFDGKDAIAPIEALRKFARYGALLPENVEALLQSNDPEIVKILISRLHHVHDYRDRGAIIDLSKKTGMFNYVCEWANSDGFLSAEREIRLEVLGLGCELNDDMVDRLLKADRTMAIGYLTDHDPERAEELINETLTNGGVYDKLNILGCVDSKKTPNVIKPAIKVAIELLRINRNSKEEFQKRAKAKKLEVLMMYAQLADPFRPDPDIFCPVLRFLGENREYLDDNDTSELAAILDWVEEYPEGDPYTDPTIKAKGCVEKFRDAEVEYEDD